MILRKPYAFLIKYFQKIKDEFKQDGFQNMKVNVSVKIKGQEKGNLNRGVVK